MDVLLLSMGGPDGQLMGELRIGDGCDDNDDNDGNNDDDTN
jgi:hypothetical protein